MPKSPSIRNSKRRGEWAELRFMAEAVQRGFNVMRPWGESARYDVLLERSGRYLRVQVKSTQYKIGKAYVCGLRSDNKFKPYRRAEIDFVAAYVIPANVWYILPARKKEFLGGNVWLSPHLPHHRHEQYMNAWHLLTSTDNRPL
jgi:hypothetical protein